MSISPISAPVSQYIEKARRLVTPKNLAIAGIAAAAICALAWYYRQPQPNIGYFWELTHDNKPVGYLLGSVHVATPDILEFNPKILECFTRSAVLATEICLSSELTDEDKKAQEMSKNSFNTKLTSFTEAEKNKFCQKWEKVGFKRKPNETKENYLFRIFDGGLGYYYEMDQTTGMDYVLYRMAVSLQKQNVGLEDRSQLVEKYSEELVSKEEIRSILSLPERTPRILSKIIASVALSILLSRWKRGDLAALSRQLRKPSNIMVFRNQQMAQSIANLSRKNETFFAVVGAKHVAGEDSVLDILQKRHQITSNRILP